LKKKINIVKFTILPIIILVVGAVAYAERWLNLCVSDSCRYYAIVGIGKPLLIIGVFSLISFLLIYSIRTFNKYFIIILNVLVMLAIITIFSVPVMCGGFFGLCFDKELVSLLFSTGLLALAVLAVLYKGLRILLKK